jgi:hypothetical protein
MATMNLKVRLTRKRKNDLKWFIDAIGFLRHVLPGDFVGPCATTSADLSEFTPSAFPLIAFGIAKILEDFRLGPDFLKRYFPDISTIQFQIATGLDLADMGDEAEGDAPETSTGHGIQSMFFWSDLLSLFFRPLPQNAIIVRSTGRFQLEGDFVNLVVKPMKGFFIIET